jgi:hypothetical protein
MILFVTRAITELEHHDVNIIIKNRYMQSMKKGFQDHRVFMKSKYSAKEKF